MSLTIRLAELTDAPAVLNLYAPYVRDTAISFEYDVPPLEAFQSRMAAIRCLYPFLVAQEHDEIIGYAYAAAYRSRAAFAWDAETSVYVDRDHQARGVGRRLYDVLLDLLRLQGFHNALAVITFPGTGSIAFHEALGFTRIGVQRAAGFKHGAWHDVALMHKRLREPLPPGEPPVSLEHLDREAVTAILGNRGEGPG